MKQIIPTIVSLSLIALTQTSRAQLSQAPAPRPVPAAPAKPPAPPKPVSPSFDLQTEVATLQEDVDAANVEVLAAHEAYAKAIGARPNPSAGTLVIPKDASDPKAITDAEEDLNVMAHILRKASSARDEKKAHAMGIFVHSPFSASSAAPQNLYIEGYGALFFLNVNYPLVPPPAAKNEEPEAKADTSSEWEAARRELYRPPEPAWKFDIPLTKVPSQEYDADRVESLKKELISALKNAAHIRKLKSDEAVIVVVTGPETRVNPTRAMRVESRPGTKKATVWSDLPAVPGVGKLILRAKKPDIEAFQKQKVSLEDFRKKVTVMLPAPQ